MTIAEELNQYDPCFVEFLDIPRNGARNGQKHMQAILMREAFHRLRDSKAGIQADGPTPVLDVSSGTGAYTVQWLGGVSDAFPKGIEYHGTDFSTQYVDQTHAAVQARAAELGVVGEPSVLRANLFQDDEPLIAPGKKARVVHWSHSGYHVRDALAGAGIPETSSAITAGLQNAVNKVWDALDEQGVLVSIHQTNTDGSEMFSKARKYSGVLDDVPATIERMIWEKRGFVHTVEFTTPLEFPATLAPGQWAAIKNPEQWEDAARDLDVARALRLLSFVLYDFSQEHKEGGKSAMQRLHEKGKLGDFTDEMKALIQKNGGHLNVKCAFQLACKTPELNASLEGIARELKGNMEHYLSEMGQAMYLAGRPTTFRKAASGNG